MNIHTSHGWEQLCELVCFSHKILQQWRIGLLFMKNKIYNWERLYT
jgi:hypothetical protein